MRFDLTDLRLFLAVVDAGSITQGARHSGLSLAAASERLRDMEADGQVKLLERSRRGVVPTRAGETLVHHARLIHRQMAHMHDELGQHAKGLRATIRLVANTAAAAEFLPALLGSWMAAHPQVNIDLQERQSIDIANAVRLGLADIGIMSAAADIPGLQLRPFAKDQLVLIVPRGHALAAHRTISLADVAGEDFIGLSNGALQTHLEAQAAKIGIRLNVRARMRTFDSICRLVADAAGLGIVPATVANRCQHSMNVTAIPLVEPWATRHLSLCFRADADLTPTAHDLVDHLARASEGRRSC